jgi:23S rRNA (uridine2552-2'-O)-methyltransferase
MARSKSSHRWLKEHFSDPYVKRAQQQGYRSRAAYKLIEIQEKDKLIKPGMTVVDLGAAPGGWSQLVAKWVGRNGKVFALDILPMDEIEGVTFIQGDFREADILQALLAKLAEKKVDLLISDMAPNLSGFAGVDRPRSIYLAELALELAEQVLKSEGDFLIKLFQGEGFDAFLVSLRKLFSKVMVRKPPASKAKSAEVYLVAKGYRKETSSI